MEFKTKLASSLVYIGVFLVILGALLNRYPYLFSWFGKLPGDFRYEGERSSVFFPLSSMIILSLLLSIVLAVVGKMSSGR